MADDEIERDRNELIAEIRFINTELVKLGVDSRFYPNKFTTRQLVEELESRADQLKQRKKFIGLK